MAASGEMFAVERTISIWEIVSAGDGADDKQQAEPPIQRQLQPSQHALPRIPSMPSFPMIGTITSPATGSAHHQPNNAFSSKPPNRIADRYVQKSACLESAFMALLPIPAATRRFARARSGMTMTEAAATITPGTLRFGASWPIRVEPDS